MCKKHQLRTACVSLQTDHSLPYRLTWVYDSSLQEGVLVIIRNIFSLICKKIYVVTIHLNHLYKTDQMRGHNISQGQIRKNVRSQHISRTNKKKKSYVQLSSNTSFFYSSVISLCHVNQSRSIFFMKTVKKLSNCMIFQAVLSFCFLQHCEALFHVVQH